MSDESLVDAMIDEPTLLRRPLIVADGLHAVGFDREQLNDIVRH